MLPEICRVAGGKGQTPRHHITHVWKGMRWTWSNTASFSAFSTFTAKSSRAAYSILHTAHKHGCYHRPRRGTGSRYHGDGMHEGLRGQFALLHWRVRQQAYEVLPKERRLSSGEAAGHDFLQLHRFCCRLLPPCWSASRPTTDPTGATSARDGDR